MYVITHSGVKGMKWGVRRYQNPDGSYTELGKQRHAADARHKGKNTWFGNAAKKMKARFAKRSEERRARREAARKNAELHKKKNVKDMSDAELREVVNRLNMERQYKQLMSEQDEAKKKKADGIIASSSKQIVKNIADATVKKISEAITSALFPKKETAEEKSKRMAAEENIRRIQELRRARGDYDDDDDDDDDD